MALIDDLGSQGSHGRADKVFCLGRIDFDRFGDLLKMVASTSSGKLKSVSDSINLFQK
jgi:hypothetical protein